MDFLHGYDGLQRTRNPEENHPEGNEVEPGVEAESSLPHALVVIDLKPADHF